MLCGVTSLKKRVQCLISINHWLHCMMKKNVLALMLGSSTLGLEIDITSSLRRSKPFITFWMYGNLVVSRICTKHFIYSFEGGFHAYAPCI